MARVVERRKGIPWTLIVFVFLFLVAATLAVLWRIELDDRMKDVSDGNSKLDLYTRIYPAPTDEPTKSVWQHRMEALVAEARKPNGRGVFQQLIDREQPLIDAIVGVGKGLTPEAAAVKGRDVLVPLAQGKPENGLIDVVQATLEELKAAQAKRAETEKSLEAANAHVAELTKQAASIDTAHKDEVAALNAKLTAATGEVGKVDDKRKGELEKIKKEYEDRIEKLNADSNRYQGDIDKLKGELRKATAQLGIVAAKLAKYEKARKPSMIYHASGQVLQVKPEDGVVYINLGEKDRVVTGLTFAVYPGERGVPQVVKDDGTVTESQKLKGKAQLYVLQVFDKISLCRVDWQANPADPIVKGDLIGNLAFDPVRTFRFAVIGDFDLYSAGKPQEADADHVKFLIRRFRGEVNKDIDDQTDFLIVGTKPAETPAMEGEESPQMVKARQEKEKRRADYERIRKLAEARDIPILNANEFLALVGYTPQNTLKTFGPTGR